MLRQIANFTKCLVLALSLVLPCATSALAIELEGFTEPSRSIKVAVDETGTIEEVFVREGQAVKAGEPLVRLNDDMYEMLLAIAEQNMKARGRLSAATSYLQMLQNRLDKLRLLRLEGHARQEEVDRATAETKSAEANVRTVQEDLITKRLEHKKIKAQIARRTVRAPIAGVVTQLYKDKGEFVGSNSPDVLMPVQIDSLLANFTFTSRQASKLSITQEMQIRFLNDSTITTRTVAFISPITDAQSGTVLVKVRIDNSDARFRSGDRCTIRLGKQSR